MAQKIISFLIIFVIFFLNVGVVSAQTARPTPSGAASVFGRVEAPSPLADFVAKDPTGSFGISQFLSNLVNLFFTLAGIVLIFVLIWGAFDWIISEGNKEKLAAARGKIISAIIGIILFAIAFAVIQLLGNFTGFTFFRNQH